jgi:hypothetical protein
VLRNLHHDKACGVAIRKQDGGTARAPIEKFKWKSFHRRIALMSRSVLIHCR